MSKVYYEKLYIGHVPLYGILRDVLAGISFDNAFIERLKRLAEEGVIVYALKDRSHLNTIILYDLALRTGIPRPTYSYDVNMLLWQPVEKALGAMWCAFRCLFSSRLRVETDSLQGLREQLDAGAHTIIHLGGAEFFENRKVEEALSLILEKAPSLTKPIYLVPVMITYGRRREKEEEGIINILFGQSEYAGPFRRFLAFLRYATKIIVIPTEPVKVTDFLEKNRHLSQKEMTEELRSRLLEDIDAEKMAMLGPTLKSRREIMELVMQDKELKRYLDEVPEGKKEAMEKAARRYLDEIAADYDEGFISFFYRFFTWLWNNIYDGIVVDKEGLAEVRRISKKMPFVVIPCHRSHIDYIVIHYLFYEHHIQLPFIAAGINMAFGPFKYVFRHSGAFFIRRSFRGNELYQLVLSRYIKVLLSEGLPIEFFIEGGRSRTGKMVMPKYGLLSMIIQAFQEKAVEDLALIPVYVGYDRVIEEKSYVRELGGMPKTQESTVDIVKSSRILGKRFGRVYVNIGEPIYLKSYLSQLTQSFQGLPVEERQKLYRKIGYDVVTAINRVAVVTPFALVSTAFLAHDRRGISYDELREILFEFFDYLQYRKANLAVTFANRGRAISEVLNIFEAEGLVSRLGIEEEDDAEVEETVYCLEDDKRIHLEYYKNTILNYFIPISFVASSMLSHHADTVALDRVISDYQFLKRLFWHEFIFDDKRDDLEEVNEALAYFHDRGVLTLRTVTDGSWLEIRGRGRSQLRHFAGLVANYVDSYWIVFRGLAYLRKGPRNEREWMKKLHKLGEKMFRKGEIRRAEALSQANYMNAIHFLEDEGIISVQEIAGKKDRKESTLYTLTGEKRQIEILRRRIFRFM
ncbi:MAG: 1-acyl-sn-glycerol-3-phosphate acyltransferase [Syntrophales bacterium]|nr:1-acyl-sn-glycerol-3-phosphate acyltransferase [Syntrophales bacterium]